MDRPYTEIQVLKKLDIPDFRHLTKDKVIAFATMIPGMEPEVAKKALEQFPNFVSISLEIMKEYRGGVRAIFMFSFVSFCARKIHRLL